MMFKQKFTRWQLIVLMFLLAVGLLFLMSLLKPALLRFRASKEPTSSAIESDVKILSTALGKQVQVLTDKDVAGRCAGKRGAAQTCIYLADQLQKMGLKPAGEEDTFFQSFPIPQMYLRLNQKRAVFVVKNYSSRQIAENVLGIIESNKCPNQYIVLSAHLDHLGIWRGNLYPGANDNASGVATVLEIARVLSEEKEKLPCSILVAFWSAEEMGLLGSNYFVNNPTISLDEVKLNINLDSIGSGENSEFICWSESGEDLPSWLSLEVLTRKPLELEGQVDRGHGSDHNTFLKKDIPALTILAENWLENNHTPQDVPDKLNFDKMATLGDFLVETILESEQKIFGDVK